MNQSHERVYIENALIAVSAVLFVFFGYLVYRGTLASTVSVTDNVAYLEVQGESTDIASTQQTVVTTEPVVDTLSSELDFKSPGSTAVLVNKKFGLPADYSPSSLTLLNLPGSDDAMLTEEAALQLRKLFTAAAEDGVSLTALSGYRSFDEQKVVYESFLTGYNEGYADTVSARPGYSEHQIGLGVDLGASDGICELDICFGETRAGKWLAQQAHNFGFTIRYLQGKEMVTGYEYEPWHLRYFGVGLATELYTRGVTYEEYLGVSGGDYAE